MRNRTGFSLLELVLVLVILGGVLSAAVPPIQRVRHTYAVHGARAELAGAVAATRAAAILAGGATLYVDPGGGAAWIESAAGARLGADYPLAARFGVRLETDRGLPVSVRYDALGIGRMSATTVGVRHGTAYATLIISSYGRVRL